MTPGEQTAPHGGNPMYLSREHALIRRTWLEQQIKELPAGNEFKVQGKYPAVYISDYPGHPEYRRRRIAMSKARDIYELIKLRDSYINELGEIEAFLKERDHGREPKPEPFLDLDFYKYLKLIDKYNTYEKPKYAPKLNGIEYRSKSELNIAQLLASLGLKFLYEPEYEIFENEFVYPDFVAALPELDRSFVIEHFGMWDEKNYKKDALEKIDKYISRGFVPGRDIIFTFESDKVPLDIDVVKNQINALIITNSQEEL